MELSEYLPRESGRDYALRMLKDNIISLKLEPGRQISENEIAAEMGLSRTPVREALFELARIKIIESFPQKKSVVSLIDYNLVEEVRFMRSNLEKAVVELVCEMAAPADIERLQENLSLQRVYLENFNPGKLLKLDDKFHQLLFEIAQKPNIFTLMNTTSIHFDRVRNLALVSVKDVKYAKDHEQIVEAIMAHDAKTAVELMDVHLKRYKIDAVTLRERYPQYMK